MSADYIKQLEEQNENLQNKCGHIEKEFDEYKIAYHRYMPKWFISDGEKTLRFGVPNVYDYGFVYLSNGVWFAEIAHTNDKPGTFHSQYDAKQHIIAIFNNRVQNNIRKWSAV